MRPFWFYITSFCRSPSEDMCRPASPLTACTSVIMAANVLAAATKTSAATIAISAT